MTASVRYSRDEKIVRLTTRLRTYELDAIRSALKGSDPPGSPATILFTSGSTGVPKGAYLTREGAEHWGATSGKAGHFPVASSYQ